MFSILWLLPSLWVGETKLGIIRAQEKKENRKYWRVSYIVKVRCTCGLFHTHFHVF